MERKNDSALVSAIRKATENGMDVSFFRNKTARSLVVRVGNPTRFSNRMVSDATLRGSMNLDEVLAYWVGHAADEVRNG